MSAALAAAVHYLLSSHLDWRRRQGKNMESDDNALNNKSPNGSGANGEGNSPLKQIYSEIETALEHGLFYLAITVTTSLPDVCSALEGNVPTNWETYKTWFRENVGTELEPFGDHECYELRCGVVHQAKFMGVSKNKWSEYDALFFTLPDGRNNRVMGMTIQMPNRKILSMDVVHFCSTMISAARRWEEQKKGDASIQQRMAQVVRVRPEGLAPYIVGLPVFA